MLPQIDLTKSLQELEHSDWGEPVRDSHLVITCYKLRRVPLKQFTLENLRIMIGQEIGLTFLVPIALKHIHHHPLAGGDFHPGDLLVALLRVEATFWIQHPEYCKEIHQIIQTVILMGQKKKKKFSESIKNVMTEYQLFPKRLEKSVEKKSPEILPKIANNALPTTDRVLRQDLT
jgi:hypothetical protein